MMSASTKTAIVLVNTGTPKAPTPRAVRQYLEEFLSDPRIIELPKWKWWPILHGIILRKRPAESAKRYQLIWDEKRGSPLLQYGQELVAGLSEIMRDRPLSFYLAMRYGQPSIRSVLRQLTKEEIDRICFLPLFPQFAPQTTMSVYDEVFDFYRGQRSMPGLVCIPSYHMHPAYIDAIASQIEEHWHQHGKPIYGDRAKLLLTFHGVPQSCVTKGDQYQRYCEETAQAIRQRLGLTVRQAPISFQSRFGKEEWLQPYTEPLVRSLGATGVRRIDVIAPGFAMDCLETKEELNDRVRRAYLRSANVSGQYFYIDALNASERAIQMYKAILESYL